MVLQRGIITERRGAEGTSPAHEASPLRFAPSQTDLDDYDASTRQMVCLSLGMMFRALPGAFGEQPVLELYPALLKRLDDSSDDVRIAVCQTLVAFFAAAPAKAYHGTCIDYSLDQLFVHLDDTDSKMQAAVNSVIQATIPIDSTRVVKKATDCRMAHRSTTYLDALIAEASTALASRSSPLPCSTPGSEREGGRQM